MGPLRQLIEYSHIRAAPANRPAAATAPARMPAADIVEGTMPPRSLAAALAAGLLLTAAGCSALLPERFGPERGPDGRVTEPVEAAATWLVPGDCFDFVDDGDHARVTLTPCSGAHDWEVIAQGDLTLREEKETGPQNAVSAKCEEPFAAFAERADGGARPWQQFLLSEAERENRTVTVYTCIATTTVEEP